MDNSSGSDTPPAAAAEHEAANPREHSETAAEGNDGLDLPEIRMHSQDPAEGPDEE